MDSEILASHQDKLIAIGSTIKLQADTEALELLPFALIFLTFHLLDLAAAVAFKN